MTGELLIVVPVHHRPQNLAPLLRNIAATTPSEATTIIVPTADDTATMEEAARLGCWTLAVKGKVSWAQKLNEVYRLHGGEYRYLFAGADDVAFTAGWYEAAKGALIHGYKVAGTLDMLTTKVMDGHHATHHLVDRTYLDDPGGVIDEGPRTWINEAYRHNYADDEFIGTAIHRRVFTPSRAVVRHLHHLAGSPYDETYRIGDDSKWDDHLIHAARHHLWT